jgi:hypothetical protein
MTPRAGRGEHGAVGRVRRILASGVDLPEPDFRPMFEVQVGMVILRERAGNRGIGHAAVAVEPMLGDRGERSGWGGDPEIADTHVRSTDRHANATVELPLAGPTTAGEGLPGGTADRRIDVVEQRPGIDHHVRVFHVVLRSRVQLKAFVHAGAARALSRDVVRVRPRRVRFLFPKMGQDWLYSWSRKNTRAS